MSPEPEGPDRISEKVRRTREGYSGRIWRAFWHATGFEELSPARKAAVLGVGAAGIMLLGLGVFTDLPYSWLITAALAILPILFHKKKEEPDEDGGPHSGLKSGSDNREG